VFHPILDEPALCSIDRRRTDLDCVGDLLVGPAGIGGQQDLSTLDPTNRASSACGPRSSCCRSLLSSATL
jgi:hypothetical protein